MQFLEQKLNEEQNVYVKLPNEPLLFKLDLQKKNEDKESLIFKTLDSSIDYRQVFFLNFKCVLSEQF